MYCLEILLLCSVTLTKILWPWHPKWPLLAGWDWRLTIINKEQSARLVLFWPWGQGRIQQRVCTIVGTRWRGLLTLGWKVEVCLIIQSSENKHALVLTLIIMGWFPIFRVQTYCFYLTSIFFPSTFELHFCCLECCSLRKQCFPISD